MSHNFGQFCTIENQAFSLVKTPACGAKAGMETDGKNRTFPGAFPLHSHFSPQWNSSLPLSSTALRTFTCFSMHFLAFCIFSLPLLAPFAKVANSLKFPCAQDFIPLLLICCGGMSLAFGSTISSPSLTWSNSPSPSLEAIRSRSALAPTGS